MINLLPQGAAGSAQFVEIEHKFVIAESFDLVAFRTAMRALKPVRESELEVNERYYRSSLYPHLILRHSFDPERQRLTVKDRSGTDTEVRQEIELALAMSAGDQERAVMAFLELLRFTRQGELRKNLHVFDFADCEVVYYLARVGERRLRCIEFEARAASGPIDLVSARQVLARYEAVAGLAERPRERRSLFDLLLASETADG